MHSKTLATTTKSARSILAMGIVALLTTGSAQALDGTWGSVAPAGLWSDPANWAGGTIADGSGFTGTFNLDLTADTTVDLDGPRTLTNVVFGDTAPASAGGWLLSGAGVLNLGGTTPTITVNPLGAGKVAEISAVVDGTVGLSVAGAGTLVLSGANTYTGTTNLGASTLVLAGGNNRLATTGTVNFTGAGTLNLGATEQSLASLTVGNGQTGTVTGSAGGKLTLTGATFRVGSTVTGGNQTMNMSGLPSFRYDNAAGTFTVGTSVNNTTTSNSTLTLGAEAIITAAALNIGSFSAPNANTNIKNSTLNLGQATTWNTNTITIGSGDRVTGSLQFQSVTNPLLTIRGTTGGTSRANLVVGEQFGAANTVIGTVNLVGNVSGTSGLDAMVNVLTIGRNARGASASTNVSNVTGSFTMGHGTLDATGILIGQDTSGFASTNATNSVTTATFTTGAGTVKVGTLTLGDKRSNSTKMTLNSTFNLNNGGTLQAQTITDGVSATTSNVTRAFNWNDGTIKNYDSGTDLAIASAESGASALTIKLAATGTHTFDISAGRAGTIAAQLVDASTGGTLWKAGSGTLILSGANTYTGLTTVNEGALLVTGSILGSATTVNAGGSLGGTGTVSAVDLLGGSIAPGASASAGTLTTGDLSLDLSSFMKFELATPGVVGGANDLLTVNGAFTLDGTLHVTELGSFGNGVYRLASYTGFLTDRGLDLEMDFFTAHPGSFVDVSTANQVNLVVVPEPTAAVSLFGGLGVLLGLRRRRSDSARG